MQKLDWMPLYIDDLLSSPAWTDMKDYQRGWYVQLLLRCTRGKPLGYLKLDGNLWRIAGAHNRPMWDNHKTEVMACFKSCQIDGIEMIYNERLLHVMQRQSGKYRKSRDSLSISPENLDVDFDFKEEKVCSKATKIPENFIPKDGHYAIAAELGINCEMEFQKFRDYYLGVSGSKAVKRDWDATLRNWLRNSVNYGGSFTRRSSELPKLDYGTDGCEKCEGTGWRASGLTPGRVKECECKSLKGNGTTYV